MAMTGEMYTKLKCEHDIQKHLLLEKTLGTQYKEVIHEAEKNLY